MSKRITSFFLLLLFSSSASALTSICSSEFLPLTGVNTLKHEASWSYHDNWFYNMFVEIGSEVEGTDSPSLVDEFEMQVGGSVLQFLDSPADGSYAIRGSVRVGYPLPWGFDGYYQIECPEWVGELANEQGLSDADDSGSSLESATAGDLVRISPAGDCTQAEGIPCSVNAGSLATNAIASTNEATFSDESGPAPVVATGVLDAVGENSLVVRTPVGRYFNIEFDTSPTVTRRSFIDKAAIGPGDTVGIYWASNEEADLGALQVRVYRSQIPPITIGADSLIPSKNPGLELRSIVDSVQLTEKSGLQLVYAQGKSTLLVPENAPVMLVEPASLQDLAPFSVKVRVVAYRTGDGSLQLHTIDILN